MRALLIVLDGVGIGAAPDAVEYGDGGADTLGHLFARDPAFKLPTLESLGLGKILNDPRATEPRASFGRMRERSKGKDSTTGHWEIAGIVLDEPFAIHQCFPPELIAELERMAATRFIGNIASSGTDILRALGDQHLRTGWPILYTSADSVLQIAAHEEVMPIERLYNICRIARRLADGYRIGRVIARPFTGNSGNFERSPHRHDFSLQPPPTVLDQIANAGLSVAAIGKISDLFAGQGISETIHTANNADGMAQTERIWRRGDDGLVFTNLVDFDSMFGHRRNPDGFSRALMEFDVWLAKFLANLHAQDLLIITADHGNDSTFRGSDHTREEVPLIVCHNGRKDNLGVRETFADVAATLSRFFHLPAWNAGTPFWHSYSARFGSNARINAAS